jgi:translation initiation factor IF-1
MKEEAIKVTGVIIERCRGAKFKAMVDNTDKVITCSLSGKMRTHNITIVEGDHVEIEISPYDLTNGRIVWRTK